MKEDYSMDCIRRVSGTRCHIMRDGCRVKTVHFAMGEPPKIRSSVSGGVFVEGNFWRNGKVVRDFRFINF